MKNMFKIVLKFILIFILIFILGLSVFYFKIKNNLIEKNENIKIEWRKIFNISSQRLYLIKSINNSLNKNIKLDSLIKNNQINRDKYKDLLELDFLELENKINEEIIKIEIYNGNNLINRYNDSINLQIDNYNTSVRDFNTYYSKFPNFIIAKRIHLKRKKFFSITYGKHNEDPLLKNKEIPKWMKEMEENQLNEK